MIKKEYIYGVLVAVILFLIVHGEIMRSKYNRSQDALIEAIEDYAVLKKEKEGLYSNLVNTQSSNKELNDSLKALGEEAQLLYKRIRKDNEKIITLEKIVFTLEKKLDTITTHVDTVYLHGDTLLMKSFRAYYPDRNDWFISYYGRYRDSLVYGSWDFGELQLSLLQTTTPEGLRKVYLSGPEWIKANEVTVMTAKEPDKIKFSRFWIGGGWTMSYDNSFKGPVFKGAMDIKRKFLINATIGGHYTEIGVLYGL